jgi:hypothetical protein
MPIQRLLKTATFDDEATKTLASAFDIAWGVIKRSGSTLGADHNAIATRETLANRLIAMARTGERDRQRLVNDALVNVANCKEISRELDRSRGNGNRDDLDQTGGSDMGA